MVHVNKFEGGLILNTLTGLIKLTLCPSTSQHTS